MLKIVGEGLTFDDVLLLPGFSNFKRKDVDTSVKLTPTIKLKVPVISSPMDTVTETDLALAMADWGGLGIIHRNISPKEQKMQVRSVKVSKVVDPTTACLDEKGRYMVGAAVGVGSDFEERVELLLNEEVDLITIDSGHGNTSFMVDAIKYVKKKSKVSVMAGNVATASGARQLLSAGCDVLRVGMGPGSICTTRIVSGMGVPQLWAVSEASEVAKKQNKTVVADGGIKQFGDNAKALGAGADAVMLGSMLSGFEESAGKVITVNKLKYKVYRGMGSVSAMKKGGAERYGQKRETPSSQLIAEGVEARVPYKGLVSDFLFQLHGSLKTSFYYIGAKNIKEFHEKASFIKITRSGFAESHPHSVTVTDSGKNYF